MDQPSSETSPKKSSRVRKTARASIATAPVVEPAPLDDLPDVMENEASPPLSQTGPAPAERRIWVRPPSGLNTQSLAMVALV